MRRFPPPQPKIRTWRGRQNTGGTRAWRNLRAIVLERDRHHCTAVVDGVPCTERAVEVHHINPGTDLIVPPDQLTSVCRRHNPRGGNK